MKCPFGHDRLKTVHYSADTVVERCGHCQGLWVTEEQINKIVCINQDVQSIEEVNYPFIPELRLTQERAMEACPQCASFLKKYVYKIWDEVTSIFECDTCGKKWIPGPFEEKYFQEIKVAEILGKRQPAKNPEPPVTEDEDILAEGGEKTPFFPFIFPLRTTGKTALTPYLTTVLLLINFIVSSWLLFERFDLAEIFKQYGFVPALFGPGHYYAIFTSMFIHANVFHLLGNLVYLWVFGDRMENTLGRVKFILLYFACGFAGAFCYLKIAPQSPIPAVGASGGIVGLMGAYLVFYPKGIIKTFIGRQIFDIPVLVYVLGWVLYNTLVSILVGYGFRIGWLIHLGSFVCGVLIALLIKVCRKDRSSL